MNRSERWNTGNEIKRMFSETSNTFSGAGPIVYVENGKKYSDDGEAHIGVIGRTGKGKSQCCSLPYMREVLKKGESLIMLDPKGEGFKRNDCFIPKEYQKFVVDFRNPRKSLTKWNPLTYPKKMYDSKDPNDNDVASSMISEFWNGVYPWDGHSDKFWTDASVNYAKGLTYGLFETFEDEYINLDSVAVMMEQSEERFGPITIAKAFYDMLPSDSLAKRNLATYVTGPNETRASIHSVAASGLEVFSRSRGLMEMLGEDTLDIKNLDVNRPFVLLILTPDETDVYDSLAGLLISQISQHLIRVAQDLGGRLPIRVNIILEELGSVGKSIPTLANLMVASRSRNMRLMLVLQSNAQLDDVYGKSKAETIRSSIGITIGFSTNSWETLNEWSQRCGEKQAEISGHIVKEPLITATQLAAMPTGTALVMIDNQYKFIAHFPFYNEMYDNSAWREPECIKILSKSKMKTVNFEEAVKKMKSQHRSSNFANPFHRNTEPSFPFSSGNNSPFNVDELVARIDAKLEELQALEEEEDSKSGKKYIVTIVRTGSKKNELVDFIAKQKDMSKSEVEKMLDDMPVHIEFENESDAKNFNSKVSQMGCLAILRDE